jgi:L,D-transpeptidase catalytic domain
MNRCLFFCQLTLSVFSLSWGLASPSAAVTLKPAATSTDPAVALLNRFNPDKTPYIAPDEIDARFTTALYVNVATRGAHRQRMWVLHRDTLGGPWRLGLKDNQYWKRKAKRAKVEALTPTYSWPISSGRYYRGDRRSGPTPPGIYGLDERRWRYGWGWLQAGMRHVLHIDYHYTRGRASGVAFHGTNTYRYRRLGRADSHGCIRMRQNLALNLIDRITGRDGVLPEHLRWGEVPRFWRTEKGRRRFGYNRDGKILLEGAYKGVQVTSLKWPVIRDTNAPPERPLRPRELTKDGFRTIVVFFKAE